MLLNLRKLLQKYDLSFPGVIHVGASEGQERKLYKELGIFRQVWFEPIPHVFEKLQKNLASNPQAQCFNVALGSENKPRMLTIADNGGQSSSLLYPKLHLERHSDVAFKKMISVPVHTMDALLTANRIDVEDYLLTIDTQGYELEVLKGADKTLPNIKAIITEIYRDELYEGVPMVEEIDQYLGERGFVRVETKWTPHGWGDALLIRKDLLDKVKP